MSSNVFRPAGVEIKYNVKMPMSDGVTLSQEISTFRAKDQDQCRLYYLEHLMTIWPMPELKALYISPNTVMRMYYRMSEGEMTPMGIGTLGLTNFKTAMTASSG